MAEFRLSVDREADLATATAYGVVSESDFMDVFHRLYASKPAGRILWNFSNASLANLSFSKINSFLQGDGAAIRPVRGKTALVIRPSYAYGMVRIVETLQEMQQAPYETRSFDTTEEAFAWFYLGAGSAKAPDVDCTAAKFAN